MNTVFLLLAEYGTGQIPLDRCAHISGLSTDEAAKRAGKQALPVPAYRVGTQKSPWLIDVGLLAAFLDAQKEQAASDGKKIHGRH